MIKISQHRSKKKVIIISAIIGLLLLIGGIVYLSTANSWFREHFLNITQNENKTQNTERAINDVDYSGPSKDDSDASQEGKKKNDDTNSSTIDLSSVPVAVSFASVIDSTVEIRAFIPGVIEGSGTCTATLTKNQQKVQKTSTAFIDTSSSQCNPIFIPIDEFSTRGKWTLVVSYKSSTAQGESEQIEVDL